MAEPRLDYVGPVPHALTYQGEKPWWTRLPWAFLAVVVLPTFVAFIYFLFIASPMYVAESRFVVRSASGRGTPSAFGVALQGVGLSQTQTDAFAVHEYINSMDGAQDLKRTFDMRAILGPRGADIFSRYPRMGETQTNEGLNKALRRFVLVGYDSTTGISTLRVKAFRPQDAQKLNEALLEGGERLINRMNQRSATDAVSDARRLEADARMRLAQSQQQLVAFRNRERFIDPVRTAAESSQLIGGLMETVAGLQAERSQIAAGAPQSPQLPAIDNRIAAFQRQILAERAKIAGDSTSLAPKIGTYEELVLARELANTGVSQATASLLTAEADAKRQQLYLERIVSPDLPDEAMEPKRWLSILTVFATSMLIFGVGWLLWSGVREHRQG